MKQFARRHSPPWATWAWSAGVWIGVAVAIGKSGEAPNGPAHAAFGLAAASDSIATETQDSVAWVVGVTPRVLEDPSPADAAPLTAHQADVLGNRRATWRSLTIALRKRIDAESSAEGGWPAVMVHGSDDASGCAADIFFVPRTRSDGAVPSGPHFIIGNGSRSADGSIEVTRSPFTAGPIEIVLVGDLRSRPPSDAQLRALTELVDYLRAKVGVVPVSLAPNATLVSQAAVNSAF